MWRHDIFRTGVPVTTDSEQRIAINDELSGIDAALDRIDGGQRQLVGLVVSGELSETQSKNAYDELEADRQELIQARQALLKQL